MTKRGHEQPLLDNQEKDDLFSVASSPETTKPIYRFEDHIPEKVKHELKHEVKDADEEWERLDHSGYPPTMAQIRQEVGGTALTAEDVERIAVEKVKASLGESKRPKKDRRNLGPKQQNTADGDKRVEAIYGPRD